ncbi:MAG: sugar phosphate nucleotidyltransferase [bacterium]|nr:sugar phosphate nucleotidyltransferase [bacterium]
MDKKITQAVILAGGRGERLRPLTDDRPKPMVLVNGRPFLEYQFDLLKKNGIEEIVILVGYMKEKIMDYFGDGSRFGVRVKYSEGTVEDDTGTRIRNARDLYDQEFFLLNGDIYWPALDVPKLSDFYHAASAMALMVVYDNKDGRGEQGFKCNVKIGDHDRIVRYVKNTAMSPADPECIWTEVGVYILSRAVVDTMPKTGNFSHNDVTFRELVGLGELVAWKTDVVQETITTPEHLADFADKMKRLKAP